VDDRRYYGFENQAFISVTSVLDLVDDKDFLKPGGPADRSHRKRNRHYPWEDYINDAALSGEYLHYWITSQLAREAGLPAPDFEMEAPHPIEVYTDKFGKMWSREENWHTMLKMWNEFQAAVGLRIHGVGVEQFLTHWSGYGGRVDLVVTMDSERFTKWVEGNRFTRSAEMTFLSTRFQPDDVWIIDIKSSKGIYNTYPAQIGAYFRAWNWTFPEAPANRMGILRFNAETGVEFYESDGDEQLWDRAMAKATKLGLINPNLTVEVQR
jgi:hypothetical protein